MNELQCLQSHPAFIIANAGQTGWAKRSETAVKPAGCEMGFASAQSIYRQAGLKEMR
jgi:hypothetical protein